MTASYGPSFEEHASPEAIAAHLQRKRRERQRLDNLIGRLERLLERRTRERGEGVWPPEPEDQRLDDEGAA